MKRLFFYLTMVLAFSAELAGQAYLKEAAEKLLASGRYKDVISVVEAIPVSDRSGEVWLIRGIASHGLNDADGALADLRNAYKLEERHPYIFLYSAKAYYAKGNYEEAALNYKLYLKGIPSDHNDVAWVTQEIKRCAMNMHMTDGMSIAYVENLGQAVNTEYDEIRPVNSPNYLNKYYFSSNRDLSTGGPRNSEGLKDDAFGSYAMDMYSVELVNGNWTPVFAFNSLQNTAKHEIIQGFNSSGTTLYFLQGNRSENARLYSDPFSGDDQERAFPKEVANDFHGSIGDKDLFIFNDSIWIFSSRRKGGYGGYDLYSMERKEGLWQKAVNLGPGINSPYDELSPFLSRGSKLLIFSSNRLEGYGGFDVFVAAYSRNISGWEQVKNLGPPINSPKDDLGFTVSGDGTQAVFYSDRLKGYGGFDIYLAYLKSQMIDQLEFVAIPFWMQQDEASFTENIEIKDVFEDVAIPEVSGESVNTEKARDFLNQAVVFGENDDEISATAKTSLKALVNLMKVNPNIQVGLFSNTSTVGMSDFNLFYSAKRGEKVAEYLTERGVAANRFFILGKGDNFPEVLTSDSRLAVLQNNRVDLKLYDYDPGKIKVIDDKPVIKESLVDERSKLWKEHFNSLFYTVKIAETSQMLRTDLVKTRKDAFVLKSPGRENYQYFVGLFKTYSEARTFRNELMRSNMLNATITPFLYGRPMSDNELALKISAFPDLEEYIKFEK